MAKVRSHSLLHPLLATALGFAAACPGVDPAIDRADHEPGPPGKLAHTGTGAADRAADQVDPATGDEAPGAATVLPPSAPEPAPDPDPRRPRGEREALLETRTGAFFEGHPGHRIHVQVDKPVYHPGEAVWVKSWDLAARSLAGADRGDAGVLYQLIDPRGTVAVEKRVKETHGTATNDLEIPAEAPGGEYRLRVTALGSADTAERPLVVAAYEAPRLKKKLELLRKAYGPGDQVGATVKVERPTGEPLAAHPLTAVVWIDGEGLSPVTVKTNAEGGAMIHVQLPARIERGDALLTVMIEDGGVTESVSKRIPILLKKVDLAFFPEGGALVRGLPSRVYFEAKTPLGKPADVEGRILDDHGNPVATFSTFHAGLGRVELTPATGRTYVAEIVRPAGIGERFALPLAAEAGCVLRSFDDLDGTLPHLRVAVRCSDPRDVTVAGVLRERLLDVATVHVPEDRPAVVYLAAIPQANGKPVPTSDQGAVRLTLFDDRQNPLAERLVFRGRRSGLQVEITPDKAAYIPRDQVALTVKTTDPAGHPVPAELALSVVDDTVLAFADDKNAHVLSRLLLEPELAERVEEPNFFFDLTERKSALAMDLLMGTRGYRRFDWQAVLAPPAPLETAGGIGTQGPLGAWAGAGRKGARGVEAMEGAIPQPPMMPAQRALPAAPAAAPPPAEPRPEKDRTADRQEARQVAAAADKLEALAAPRALPQPAGVDRPVMGKPMPEGGRGMIGMLGNGGRRRDADAVLDDERLGAKVMQAKVVGWAPVRVFPAPVYHGRETGPRSDFRETIHWAPRVETGANGIATVSFYLSDAVTSFRVMAEGMGGGRIGRAEKVLKSSLPFSMSVKLPLEVSANDHVLAPVTLSNDSDRPVAVTVRASFGDRVTLGDVADAGADLKAGDAILGGTAPTTVTLPPGARRSVYYPLAVGNAPGASKVAISAEADGLEDAIARTLEVVPLGFPSVASASGTLRSPGSSRPSGSSGSSGSKRSSEQGGQNGEDPAAGVARQAVSLDIGDPIPGSARGMVKLYPSPVATIVGGLDGMLREPGGCFEQTSSANYPNIMVLSYLKANDVAAPELVEHAGQMLDRGYQRLVGFETASKGYEWFGQAPAHEALTAYGLLEFTDMRQFHGGVDDRMVARTAAWLKSRRDGHGGFLRDPKAIDSFGAAKPEVTNAYIAYALAESGDRDLGPELAAQVRRAESTQDPYLLALAASTLIDLEGAAGRAAGDTAAARLEKMQQRDGRWAGADHSITRSTGINLDVETTALALLALMKRPGHEDAVRRGVEWLNANRGAFGAWNATQATVLALKAMTTYAALIRRTPSSGRITVLVNGQRVAAVPYEAGRRDPIVIDGLERALVAGRNEIVLGHEGGGDLPFTVTVESRAVRPPTSDRVAVGVTARLDRTTLRAGETVRLTARIENRTTAGLPMTTARIGLPGGLTSQAWQLKELREKGAVAFVETRAREVIVYFRDLAPGETKEVPLDLMATVAGEFTGPASSAYLYYADDVKAWSDPLQVRVAR